MPEPGVMAHAYSLSTRERQEDHQFKASLDSVVRLSLKREGNSR